jgi:hypothetical protein
MPTRRVLSGKLLTAEQHQRVLEALRPALGGADPSNPRGAAPRYRARGLRRSTRGRQGGAHRHFSVSYGLMRGLAAAFVVVFVLAISAGKGAVTLGTLVVLFLLALYRMHRYSQHYATELFVQYLALRAKKPDTPA